MAEANIEQMRADGWGNCPQPKCRYFFRQKVLEQCPMCRHPWRKRVGYQQPPYEMPTLE